MDEVATFLLNMTDEELRTNYERLKLFTFPARYSNTGFGESMQKGLTLFRRVSDEILRRKGCSPQVLMKLDGEHSQVP